MLHFLQTSLFLLIIISYSIVSDSAKNPNRMAMKLIYRKSMTRPPVSLVNHIEHLNDISLARFRYLRNLIDKELSGSNFQVDVQQAIQTSMFYVNFSIGQPPVPQFTVMDTGSSLLWIKCLPCKSCSSDHINHPLFNPTLSSSFVKCSCTDPLCRFAPNRHCSSSNDCVYEQRYLNGPGSKGVLAKEKLTFTTPSKTAILTKPVAFGCSQENEEGLESGLTGILGLGGTPTSLAVQLGSKFSYCIGDLSDKNYGFNQLVLGDDADILGDPTPIETENGFYFMSLEGINVGDRNLNITPALTRKRAPGTGVILDSGTVLTWLADIPYRELYNEVKSILDTTLQRFWYRDFLCYHGKITEELIGFPVVTFHFTGGAEIAMEAASMFFPNLDPEIYSRNVFCMAVRPATSHGRQYKDFTTIGLMGQQYYNIAYDLKEENIYLQRIDCGLLDDYSQS